MNKLTKKFQLWSRGDYSYSLSEFETLEELLDEVGGKWTLDFYVTQRVDLGDIPTTKPKPTGEQK